MTDFTLPIKLTNNNDGQTRHFGKSAAVRKQYAKTIAQLRLGLKAPPDYPQRITITRILGKGERLWDADSVLRGSAKQLLDSLVEANYFHDDCPKWLTDAHGNQDDSQRNNGPAVRVLIEKT